MANFKKNYDSAGFSKGISSIKNEKGELEIELTKKSRLFEESCHNYSRNVAQIHQNISDSINRTVDSLNVVVNNINYIVDYFAELHEAYN